MVPSGSPNPLGGGQTIPASLLRQNSGFPPLMSPRTQFSNNTNMLGNLPFGNNGVESDPVSDVGNRMGFNPSNSVNPNSPAQIQGPPTTSSKQILSDQEQSQYQSIRNLSAVKLEPQQIQGIKGLGPVKVEPQQLDVPSFLNQQQQQQLLQMSRQSPQAAAALLHQQRLLQLQQHQQQQQFFKGTSPQQRSPLQPPVQPSNLPLRSAVKPAYEPGMCARRLTHYMYQQQHRPEDNNIDFWRKFVAEYFAPNARKKWCVSMYGSGRQTTGVVPQDVWHCEICNRKPGRGFEATAEVLPRLFKIKYESGTLEELLYVDMPKEYPNTSGQIVLDYAKAIQESVFDQLRVVREGQLRIVFSLDLKICSWEFCAQRHEELIPRRLLIPQVSQLGAAAQKYQTATQNTSSNLSSPELQNNCNTLLASARQMVKALEVPLVNDLGYTKRYVRCLQISEVVNSMKDLIHYSRETGAGPMESLAKFPRRTSSSSGFNSQPQPPEEQLHEQKPQIISRNSSFQANATQLHEQKPQIISRNSSFQANATQLASTNGLPSANNMSNSVPLNSTRQNNTQINGPNSPYAAVAAAQIQSPPSNSSVQKPSLSGDGDSQSSVEKIIQDMMMNNQAKNVNGFVPMNGNMGLNSRNYLGNGGENGHSAMINGRVDHSMNRQEEDPGNQFLGSFSNFQFDWKSSP